MNILKPYFMKLSARLEYLPILQDYEWKVQGIRTARHTSGVWIRVMLRSKTIIMVKPSVIDEVVKTLLPERFYFQYVEPSCDYVSLIFYKEVPYNPKRGF